MQPNPDYDLLNALTINILKSHVRAKLIKAALDSGANVNIKDTAGNTPLILALKKQEWVMAGTLLEHGYDADTNIANKSGSTALTWAAATGNDEVIKCLINYGAQVNKLDSSGHNALHHALDMGNLLAANILMLYGATLNPEKELAQFVETNTAKDTLQHLTYNFISEASIKDVEEEKALGEISEVSDI